MNENPYAGTGGTSGSLDRNYVVPESDSAYWGEEYIDRALLTYSKTDTSATIDKGLTKAQTVTDKLVDSTNKWLGYFSDPDKIENVLKMATVIVVILGVVYVIAVLSPVIAGLAR